MGKKLSEMTLQELWELFPIVLTEHDPRWLVWYKAEEEFLRKAFLTNDIRIEHIGSTAVEYIWAKPIVDILVEVPIGQTQEKCEHILSSCGYRCMSRSKERMSFNKGYTENGFAEKVFHLHLRYPGDNDELYFRDWLREHPEDAKRYEKLKLSIWKSYEHDRDGYTGQKSGMVAEITAKAKAEYGERY